ncbi:Adenylate cyclase [hydrothermal vent metagenome]|uniref:Adenylate cyclase n=1 Tax=hydrothermal vent metagenome TaxID=652676 RepID=A0A3B0XH80_9ZZZZ
MSYKNTLQINAPFYIDKWLIDPLSNRIRCEDREIKLEPKVMAVLICLARNPGKVIKREQIEETAWAGMVVGYGSLASAIIKLRKAFGDNSGKRRFIETVSKKGYRLIAETRLSENRHHATSEIPGPPEKKPLIIPRLEIKKTKKLYLLLISSFIFFITVWLISSLNLIDGRSDENTKHVIIPETPAIAVLPFKNLSIDAEQEYYSDGLTADLITELAKLSKLSVVARNTVFAYKNLDVDLKKTGKSLGVNYIIEGSVRRLKDKLRITARLIDVNNNFTLWADHYDGTHEDLFEYQDKVVKKIVSSLEITLTDAERSRLSKKYSASIKAYDEFLQGWQSLWLQSREGVRLSREHFLHAIELDGQFARAYANLSFSYYLDALNGWDTDRERVLRNAHFYADKAISIDSSLPQVHFTKGMANIMSGQYQQAIQEAEIALTLNPNFADAYGLLASALNFAGQSQQAEVEMLKAMRINPGHPGVYKVIYGEILFNQGKYREATDNFELVLDRNPEYTEARRWLAASLACENRLDEANWQVEMLSASGSDISIQRIEKALFFKDPEHARHFTNALLKAGFTP